jgi:hypothetical protein
MQTFKSELIESMRVELYIANNIIDYRRQFEALLHRLTIIVEINSNCDHQRSPTPLAELIENQSRIRWNINNLNTRLNESRTRYAEIQSSLSECDAIIEKHSAKINKK